ncbi:MAG: hypothetical protein AB1425_00455 [Actinomycetota bacterium]
MFFKRPPRIPDPGQRVRIKAFDEEWRGGFRAISEPETDERGDVVIWVAEEEEYRAADIEGRPAVGMPWPVSRMQVEG